MSVCQKNFILPSNDITRTFAKTFVRCFAMLFNCENAKLQVSLACQKAIAFMQLKNVTKHHTNVFVKVLEISLPDRTKDMELFSLEGKWMDLP